jgi:hypothetical protein
MRGIWPRWVIRLTAKSAEARVIHRWEDFPPELRVPPRPGPWPPAQADETGLSLQPTQRELKNLLDLGLVKKRETATRVYYEIDTLSPFFKPLREIFGSVLSLKDKGNMRP